MTKLTGRTWHAVAPVEQFQADAGVTALVGGRQVAIFNFGRTEWYALQNECPHKHQMVLSRGIIGDKAGQPKVACPLHKNQFSLVDGHHLGGQAEWNLDTFAVRIRDGMVEVEL